MFFQGEKPGFWVVFLYLVNVGGDAEELLDLFFFRMEKVPNNDDRSRGCFQV